MKQAQTKICPFLDVFDSFVLFIARPEVYILSFTVFLWTTTMTTMTTITDRQTKHYNISTCVCVQGIIAIRQTFLIVSCIAAVGMVGQPAPGCTWPAHTGCQSAGSSQRSHRTIPVQCMSVSVCVCDM